MARRSTTGTVESCTAGVFNATGDAVDVPFNFGTDADRGVSVEVFWNGSGTHTMPDAGVTIVGGGALTPQGPTVAQANLRGRSYFGVNPPAGAQTVRVDPGAGFGADLPVLIVIRCRSEVDQTTPLSGYVPGNGNDPAAPFESPLSVASEVNDLVDVAHGLVGAGSTGGAPTGFTERFDTPSGIGALRVAGGDAPGAASVATVVTWSGVFSLDWIAFGYSWNPAAGGGATEETAVEWTGAGALALAENLDIVGPLNLVGAGELELAAVFPVSLVLAGAGQLTATPAAVASHSVAFAGAGSLRLRNPAGSGSGAALTGLGGVSNLTGAV